MFFVLFTCKITSLNGSIEFELTDSYYCFHSLVPTLTLKLTVVMIFFSCDYFIMGGYIPYYFYYYMTQLIGDIVCTPQSIVPVALKFEVRIVTLYNLRVPICKGQSAIIHLQSINTTARISKLHCLLDKNTCEIIKNKPRYVAADSCALITLKVEPPGVCLELYKVLKSLGRIIIRREGTTIAVGIVTKLHQNKNKPCL